MVIQLNYQCHSLNRLVLKSLYLPPSSKPLYSEVTETKTEEVSKKGGWGLVTKLRPFPPHRSLPIALNIMQHCGNHSLLQPHTFCYNQPMLDLVITFKLWSYCWQLSKKVSCVTHSLTLYGEIPRGLMLSNVLQPQQNWVYERVITLSCSSA